MIQMPQVFGTAKAYFQRNPDELRRMIRSLLGLRLGVPLDAIRWLADQASRSGAAKDIEIESVPPGFRVAASIDLMRTPVRAGAVLYIERVRLNREEMRLELRIEDVILKLTGDSDTPVALLIKSGALDLSRPGNFVKYLPHPPPFLLEAHDNRITLDFLHHPKIRDNPVARHVLSLLTSLVTLHAVETDERHIDLSFRAFPEGVRHAVRSVREHLLEPTLDRARLLLPNGGC
jgi:hypothetical protein